MIISWEQKMILLWNKKIPNLCFRWHILRSYHFVAEVTFKERLQHRCFLVKFAKCLGTPFYRTPPVVFFGRSSINQGSGKHFRKFSESIISKNKKKSNSELFWLRLWHMERSWGIKFLAWGLGGGGVKSSPPKTPRI